MPQSQRSNFTLRSWSKGHRAESERDVGDKLSFLPSRKDEGGVRFPEKYGCVSGTEGKPTLAMKSLEQWSTGSF